MPEKEQTRYLILYLNILGGIVFAGFQIYIFDVNEKIEFFSFLSEGTVTCLCLYAIFLIESLKDKRAEYVPLLAGFTALFISLLTDTLDEVVTQVEVLTFFFEDVFQMAGYVFIVIGIRQWVLNHPKGPQE